MIRPATHKDLPTILAMAKACAKWMISNQIFQWNEYYPSQKVFINDIDQGDLFVLEIKGQIIGIVVCSSQIDEEYIPVKWLIENNNNLYIHRLAVHPDFQGKGYAQQLMDFVEAFALENKFCSIRLDTFSQNKRNQLFYEQRGYKRLGNIFFPKQSEHPFYCYELILTFNANND